MGRECYGVQMIDTHCHLNHEPLGDDPGAVLARASARGVDRVIVPAYDMASWPAVLDLAARDWPGVEIHAAMGLHPWVVHEQYPAGTPADRREAVAAAIASAARTVVAVGEIGLDTKIDEPALDLQLPVLRTQLELAADLDLPVILHCRGAFEELLGEIDRFGGRLRGILHAWSRGPELAGRFTKAGLLLGLGGTVTRPRAKRVRRTAEILPLDHFVLETDAPSIGLDGILPEETEPQHVADVAAALAALRGETIETIAEATTHNACRLFFT